ncbi:Response regulator receiver domain-containing protein [Reichenbachiella agariperforans]|uniref:Response regulator receiver domain-containing protein n=1 Tax=Reichenbachiella agariperforans TaxID=156994 RepID=A0A1M6K644_REIAG|nr:response regulator [Reichenbachiella agariperforans]SHJ54395.1 Response regulator receiver domain-containing protein [Reichenbachiella agariperforans]
MELILQRPQKKEAVKKYTVLYVDDEPVNLRIFQHAFKRDYNVLTVDNGMEALEMLKEQKVDLVITDQQMPRMSGVDLLAQVVPKYPDIVRMIMTGFSDIGAIIRAVNEFGLDKYLVKPWDRDQLKAEFDKALKKREEEAVKPKGDDIADSVIRLNNTILPSSEDLKALIDDSFIIYDNNVENPYGFWFGEKNQKTTVAFFNANEAKGLSIALKSYVSMVLSEIVYKGTEVETSLILKQVLSRVKTKFADAADLLPSFDLSIAILDTQNKTVEYSGVNQSIYYFDDNQKLKMLSGDKETFNLVDNGIPDVKTLEVSGVTEVYFISKNMVNQIIPSNNSSTEGVSFLQFMRGMIGKKMSEQSVLITEQLTGDKAKCMLGIHL